MPALGQPVVRLPGEAFRCQVVHPRFDRGAVIQETRLVRRVGPAVISRRLAVAEDTAAAFYYNREMMATIPGDTPSGLYDLECVQADGNRRVTTVSPRSVFVM